jgi:1-acyl-sn-glycerol-3-phosphate acyltransferase
MITLRSYLYHLILAFSVVVYASLILALSLFFNKFQLSRLATHWGKVNLKLLKLICNLDYEVQGAEFLPDNQHYLVMAKHQSTWETIALRGLLPANQCWILKKELLNYPFFGHALKATGQIAIDRTQGKQALNELFVKGLEAAKNGNNIIIFPEGTRTRFGERGKFHQGGAMLAERSRLPIIPIAHDAGFYWPKGFIIKPGVVRLVIGNPISSIDIKAKQISIEVEESIESTMDKLIALYH